MVNLSKVLALVLVLAAEAVMAAPYELRINQRDSTDTVTFGRSMPPISSSTSGILMYDGNTTLPKQGAIGTGLSWDGSTLSATAQAQVNADWSAASGVAQILNKPTLFSGAYGDLSGVPSTFTPASHTHAASDITSGTLDDARIPSLAISKTTGLQAALDGKLTTPTGSVAQYVAGNGSVASRSFSYTTRALNTCFQVSATRDASVSYAVDIAATLTLSGGQQGTVFLELFTDSGCTAGAQEVTRATNGNTGTLTVGLNTVQTNTARLQGVVPAGMYLRLRTANDTGTPSFTARPGQEVLL